MTKEDEDDVGEKNGSEKVEEIDEKENEEEEEGVGGGGWGGDVGEKENRKKTTTKPAFTSICDRQAPECHAC